MRFEEEGLIKRLNIKGSPKYHREDIDAVLENARAGDTSLIELKRKLREQTEIIKKLESKNKHLFSLFTKLQSLLSLTEI